MNNTEPSMPDKNYDLKKISLSLPNKENKESKIETTILKDDSPQPATKAQSEHNFNSVQMFAGRESMTGKPKPIDNWDVDNLTEKLSTSRIKKNLYSSSPFCNFMEEIKILCIRRADFRIMCYYLGANDINDIKVSKTNELLLIGYMMCQCLDGFMKENGFILDGEFSVDEDGNIFPISKEHWALQNKEYDIIYGGSKFFHHKDNENLKIVIELHRQDAYEYISIYSKDAKLSETLLTTLVDYTKQHNIFRGAKLREVFVHQGEFKEVNYSSKHTWENYYYEDKIKNLFELEIVGFLNDSTKYNNIGIRKRGILLTGEPGTGKSSAGLVLCNLLKTHTILWITPDLLTSGDSGAYIKTFYRFMEFVSPAVIILEDLDLFAEDRDMPKDTLRLGALMNILDGVNSIENVVTLATTNRLHLIEKALRNRPGRFDRVVEITGLNANLRRIMFKNRLEGYRFTDEVLEHLVKKTDNCKGAEIQEVSLTIKMLLMNNSDKSGKEEITITKDIVDKVITTMDDFGIKLSENSNKLGFGLKTGE